MKKILAAGLAFAIGVFAACGGAGGDLGSVASGVDPGKVSVPKAVCGPDDKPETGLQGRVPREEVDNERAAQGYTCNTELISRFGESNYQGGAGGFKVLRYVDAAGHECAYYDTTLLYPANVSAGQPPGVWVLDMSNPAAPVRSFILASQAMLSPHETLVLNEKRGILAAAWGTPATAPGQVDLYDIATDCRTPLPLSSTPVGILGHESGMSPDGNTLYIVSLDGGTMTALDISIPQAPVPLSFRNANKPHGLTISEDGTRGYAADRSGLIILDLSDVQDRVFGAEIREVSRLSWEPIQSTPQNAIYVTIQDHPYLIEFDEFSDGDDNAGAARIIDIANELAPKVVSNIRLEVHKTENRALLLDDYGSGPSDKLGFMGYNAHYCAVPRQAEPGIVACTFILSGLRIFDIRDPLNPKEVAYFNGPIVKPNGNPLFDASSYAMSAPAFVPERKEIWYSDGNTGFYAIRVTNGAWPD